MQHVAVFEEQVALTPKDMRNDIESIDAVLLEKLSRNLEGRCSRNGYVLAGTVKIMSRSMGALEKGRFTGNILFHVQAEGTVLNPPDGATLEGEVIRKNKMGIYVSYMDAIRVIIPRDLYIGDTAYDSIQIGEKIQVEIKKSRFQVNDPYILSVGYFLGLVGRAKPAPKAEADAEEADAEEADAEEAEAEEADAEEADAEEGEAEAEPPEAEAEAVPAESEGEEEAEETVE